MEIKEFQEKLAELCASAGKTNGKLTDLQVKEFFQGMNLNQEQLTMVSAYLRTQGILVEGADVEPEQTVSEEKMEELPEKKENPCLTDEDKEYLRTYLKSLKEYSGKEERLIRFMPVAVSYAADMYRDGMYLADLIQEANLCLITILSEEEERTDEEILALLKKGVKEAVNAQDEQNFGDESLVAKVQNLDSVMKELTDGEEGEPKFSVEELAIMLDMDIDEMQDIIRLTGDL